MQADQSDYATPVGLLGARDLETKLDRKLGLGEHAWLYVRHEARRRHRRAFDLRSHSSQQLAEGEWLDQVVVGAKAHPGDDVLGVTPACQQDHRQGLGRGLRANAPQELEPIDSRHGHVADHQVGTRLGQLRQRLLTVGRIGHRAPGCRERTTDDRSKHRLVVDHEYRSVDSVRLRPGLVLRLCVAGLGRLHAWGLARPAEITRRMVWRAIGI